jgi:hypothetical protein
MAGSLGGSYSLTPTPEKVALPGNYLKSSDFNFLNQYLPDLIEEEFERFGQQTIASFLRMASAEIPSDSDLIKWSEEGRLHTKYQNLTASAFGSGAETFTVAAGSVNFRVNEVVLLSSETVASEKAHGIISAVTTTTFTVEYYEDTTSGTPFATTTGANITAFVYGSEFQKGDTGISGSLDSDNDIYEVKPVIIKDLFEVSGSDMAQISWIHVDNGADMNGYLWYLKSESDTRKRFEDKLEMMMIEHIEAESGSGAETYLGGSGGGAAGTEGMFQAIENRGNLWTGGYPTAMADYDDILKRLDKQGAIEQNALFINRDMSLATDNMLAAQNSYGVGGTSYGIFDNDEDMALNLGFTGFRRGTYDFYKTDWKYLNDASTRGALVGGNKNGVLVPAGETSVYDEVLGQDMKRPFLHCRYRQSKTESRKYKTWITGSAGGAATSDLDAMQVNFLSERALCTLGANNFVLFQD